MTDHSVRQPTERERARKAVTLRIEGHSYARIAETLGWSDESGARHAVTRLLDRVEHESVAELRAVEGRRLDELQRGVWDAATSGDTDAVRAALAVMARRAKLFGLDAPTAFAVGGISESEFAAQAAELLTAIGGPGAAARALVDTVPGLARELPSAVRNDLLGAGAPEAADDTGHDAEPWSNIGPDMPGY